ncbi:ATP-binding cassette domain-containing protein [Nocardia sp. NPDC004604]|uniref:ABC transporter ATP-binding protein n=1 Tax=Nocardia sp. NPDC004604 TaxID=3157013 RepID=UPI0033B13995
MASDQRFAVLAMSVFPAVQARSLYRFYRIGDEEALALQGVSLSVTAGEFVVVAGPSGSGKSTLLNCLAGMDDPDGGSVDIGGQRLSHRSEQVRARIRARHVGMLFASGNLFDHLTVTENLRLAAALAGRHRSTDQAGLLRELGVAERGHALPSQLSGGELTRAAVAVAVVNRPLVVFADEPTGELDSSTEADVLRVLTAIAEQGTAIVVASHSAAVAAAAGRVLHLTDGRLT